MNRKTLFGSLLRRMSALGCLLAVCVVTSAQDVIEKYGGEYFRRSIIRSDARHDPIIYGERGSNGSFFRDDPFGVTGNCKKFPLASGLSVNDFVVYDDTVYFCGTKNDTAAIIGWFSVPDVFGSGLANYTLFEVPHPISSYYWVGGQDYLQEFTRISVVDRPNGRHILMLGRGRCQVDTINYGDSLGVVADLFMDYQNRWQLYYSMDYAVWFSYDDFTVASDTLVVAGHKRMAEYGNSTDYNLLPYPLPDNTNASIFDAYTNIPLPSSIVVPVWSITPAYFTASPLSPPGIVIEHLTGKAFATLCFGNVKDQNNKAMLSVYDKVGSLTYRGWFDPQYLEGYHEMKYSITDSLLAFLHATPRPVVQWVKAVNNGIVGTSVHTKSATDWIWHSIDRTLVQNEAILSGETSVGEGQRAHVSLTTRSSECMEWNKDRILESQKIDSLWDVTHIVIIKEVTPIAYNSTIQWIRLINECH